VASLPLVKINQSNQRGAPSRGVSLTIQVQEANYDVPEKSQIKKHIHEPNVMLCLHTLSTDQSESTFNVICATQLLDKDLKRI
jgi:hypothetical protein